MGPLTYVFRSPSRHSFSWNFAHQSILTESVMHAGLIVKCQDSLLFDVFAAGEYGQCVTDSSLFVALFVSAACAGLYCGTLYTSGVHTLSLRLNCVMCFMCHKIQFRRWCSVCAQMLQLSWAGGLCGCRIRAHWTGKCVMQFRHNVVSLC